MIPGHSIKWCFNSAASLRLLHAKPCPLVRGLNGGVAGGADQQFDLAGILRETCRGTIKPSRPVCYHLACREQQTEVHADVSGEASDATISILADI